jgi:hypothetical protein
MLLVSAIYLELALSQTIPCKTFPSNLSLDSPRLLKTTITTHIHKESNQRVS